MVRIATARILEQAGYEVLKAVHSGDALLLAEQHRGPIHLLLTDVVMPDISGKELADRLASLCPEVQVIYMSGYPDALAQHGVLDK